MSGLGSVFLGDRLHHLAKLHPAHHSPSPPNSPPSRPAKVDPLLSLQLRIAWLEAFVLGTKNGDDIHEKYGGETLFKKAELVQSQLSEIVENGDSSAKKFIKIYDQYAHVLSPSFALSQSPPSNAPTYDILDSSELEVLLTELEPDLRAADRDLREIDELDNRGITAAGRLPEHEHLKSRLHSLVRACEQDLATYAMLEERIASLLERYTTQVNALSQLFVSWNDIASQAEDKAIRLEREKEEKGISVFE
ncbi:hypothetical protein FRC02_010525 [Tulasnella sp. 418]|nr:hypothetical protein FRC02_010525 [Tulasnella sp. 418]